MSGGAYDYAYSKINELAGNIPQTTPLRKVFVEHLRKVADAAHDIEWVDSGDCGPGEEDESICIALGKNHVELVREEIIKDAKRILEELKKTIKKYESNT